MSEDTAPLTPRQACQALLNRFSIEDDIYSVRDSAVCSGDGYEGNSWDHPDVLMYQRCLTALRKFIAEDSPGADEEPTDEPTDEELLTALRKFIADDGPTAVVEHNNENLDRPFAWLVRVPCMTADNLGNPYGGTAELRVLLANHAQMKDPEAFKHAPPIHMHGLFPFGPIEESSNADNVGMFMLSSEEAAALGVALQRAAGQTLGYQLTEHEYRAMLAVAVETGRDTETAAHFIAEEIMERTPPGPRLAQKIRSLVPWAGPEYGLDELLDIIGRALDVADAMGKERGDVLVDASVVAPDSRAAQHNIYSELVKELEYHDCEALGSTYESAEEPGLCECGRCQLHRISDRLWALVTGGSDE